MVKDCAVSRVELEPSAAVAKTRTDAPIHPCRIIAPFRYRRRGRPDRELAGSSCASLDDWRMNGG